MIYDLDRFLMNLVTPSQLHKFYNVELYHEEMMTWKGRERGRSWPILR